MKCNSLMNSDERVSNIATSQVEYEVFLSFRGPDTRAGFTDHLYIRLIDAGIKVYRDDEELRKGEKIGPDLLKGIRESKIAIPIFSKGYAASKWCLKELVQIVECKTSNGLKVMPIFYDVTPFEVRNQTGDYAKAFESHEKCYDKNTIKDWKAALKEVGQLSGWDIHSSITRFFKKEGELVKEVTKVVLRELKKAYLIVTDYLVGVEHHVREILSMLSINGSAIQIFGIYGMGGIGKTTLAKVIYNHLLPNFENYSFLADIRETSRFKGMKFLYKRLISDILSEESANISNNDEGIRIIRERFSNKKVIILLDDVDEIVQLEGLIGKRDRFGHGSIIIITTRNKSILDSLKADWSYELGGLGTHLALQLLSKHAFRKDNPPNEYLVLSQRAAHRTGGLPLALEVFGSLLCGKSNEIWDFTLKKLEKVSHKEIRRKLSISFEALDVQQKQVFLDIACFFIGEDYKTVIHFWEDSKHPEEAIEVLQQMSLIKLQEDHTLWMHDQLRDLGREIVREEHGEPGKCSRLWNEEEATTLFMRNMGSNNVQGINLNFQEMTRYSILNEKFARLPDLRFLRVNGSYGSHYKREKGINPINFFRQSPLIFSKLRWLSWHYFPPMHDKGNISFEELTILDLSFSYVKSSWSGWRHIKMAQNLKVLNLTGCKRMVKTPNFSSLLLLKQLILRKCSNLVEIDESIRMLVHLVIIDLEGCTNLRKLPEELNCTWSLEKLIIDGTSIVEIPNWSPMRKLRVFSCLGCQSLTKVSSLDFATNLLELSFADTKITALPNSIGNLVNLLELSLEYCKGIKTLPESTGNLISLTRLDLSFSGIVELPYTIGNLKNLKELSVSYTPIIRLPTTIGKLENLTMLYARDCKSLHDIPKLPQSLVSLKVTCKENQILELMSLTNLVDLELGGCHQMQNILKLPPSLKFLHIQGYKSFTLLDLSNLKQLDYVKIV